MYIGDWQTFLAVCGRVTSKPAVILSGKPLKLIGKQALILGAAQGLDEAGKLENLDAGAAVILKNSGGPARTPALRRRIKGPHAGTACGAPGPPYTARPEKLPLSLQDHNHPVRYRNVWIRELK
jgi:hypothetical protein